MSADTLLLERCLEAFTQGLHAADRLTFQHQAERVESQEPSPLILRMRAAVDAERVDRSEGAR